LEKLVTRAKEDTLVVRRHLLARLGTERTVRKLLEVVGPAFKERAGGYTRITRLTPRVGDTAAMAVLEFVENVSEIAAKKQVKEKPVQPAKTEGAKKPAKTEAKKAAKKPKEVTKNKQAKKPEAKDK
jgi:large subunit ribosomal protein L17